MNLSDMPPLLDLNYYPDIIRKRSAVQEILARTGTPIFLCDRDILSARYRTLDQSLSDNWQQHIIGYSFKTNYQVARSGILRQEGAWAEVVSGREYRLALELGYPGRSIIFNGPYKSDDDLRLAIDEGSILNINDHDELDRLIDLASSVKKRVEIGLRLGSTLPKLGHSRFGFSMENGEALSALEKTRRVPNVSLVGLHTHLYGDTDEADIYRLAAERFGEFAKHHVDDYTGSLKYIDLGGGFPAHTPKPKSRENWNPQEIGVYIRAITDTMKRYFPCEQPQPTLIVEPGRYLTNDCAILVTRVVHVKQRDGKQIVNCDGSMSMVPLTHYIPQIIHAYTVDIRQCTGTETPTTIYGSTCRENDVLYDGPFVKTRPDDYLVHYAVGAYNSNLSPDFIFEAPGMELI
ncbi:MAG: alanine racemase [Gammaproteobacteria bacterium]